VLPDLTFLLAVLLGLAAPAAVAPTTGTTMLGTAASLLVAWALVRILADRAQAAAERNEPLVALALRAWVAVPPLLAWGTTLVAFGWREWVQAALPGALSLLSWIGLYLPMVLVFAVSWAARARVDAAIARSLGRQSAAATAWEGVKAGMRRNGLAVIPMIVLITLLEVLYLGASLGVPGLATVVHLLDDLPQATAVLVLFILALLAYVLPGVLARLLPSEPLPQGPLRETLERLAAAMHLHYRQMRVWKTGGRGLNAMVVGLTKGTRRIFVTDGLLKAMPADEVQAVFCHEAAHAQRRHLLWFLWLTAIVSLGFMLLDEPFLRVGLAPLLRQLLYLAVLWFGILGWVSRRFEREADVDGGDQAALLEPDAPPHPLPNLPAPLPEGALRMVKALKRLEGIVGPVPSHRHGTLADRAAFVALQATHPEVRARFSGAMKRLRWSFVVLGLLCVAGSLALLPDDLALARDLDVLRNGEAAYQRAFEAVEKDPAAALRDWREANEKIQRAARGLDGRTQWRAAPRRAEAWRLAGDAALRGLHDLPRARAGFEQALEAVQHPAVDAATARHVVFTSLVDLGRVAVGEGRPLQEVRALEARAKHAVPTEDGEAGTYNRARLLLLAAVIEGAHGDKAKARAELEELARRPGDSEPWIELRRDAKEELARLGPE
jgi:Zn-dependent protease with chaperone function